MAPSVTSQDAPLGSNKRKRVDEEDAVENTTTAASSQQPSKKKKKKRSKNAKNGNEYDINKVMGKDGGIDESIGKMDGKLLGDYFVQRVKRHNKNLTAVELDDFYIPEHAFLDTSSWDSSRELETMPSFLKAFSPEKGASLSKASETKGSPHTLVVTLAGLRAAEISRTLRQFQNQDCAVAKLFAKHIKLKEAQETVEKTRIGIGIGTPVRLNDLVNSGSLKLDSLKRIVVDGSYVDQKKRGIFDMKELHFPLIEFLNRAELRDRYQSKKGDKVQIIVF
ncbi:Protein cms1 [Microsporum audouinii]